ncbi:MAG TPA: hypothetical protein VI094_14785 [Propionibacteriaceae bacterium]|jgi:hypothetical protein
MINKRNRLIELDRAYRDIEVCEEMDLLSLWRSDLGTGIGL